MPDTPSEVPSPSETFRIAPLLALYSEIDSHPVADGSLERVPSEARWAIFPKTRGNLLGLPDFINLEWTHAFRTDGSGHEMTFIRAARVVLGTPVIVGGACFVYRHDPSTVAPLGSVSHPELLGTLWPTAMPNSVARVDVNACERMTEVAALIQRAESDNEISFAMDQLLRGDAATSGPRKIFEYTVGLEALLLEDAGELRFRFAATLAEVLGLAPDHGRREWFERGLDMYRRRSEYANGDRRRRPSLSDIRTARLALRLALGVGLLARGESWRDRRRDIYRELLDGSAVYSSAVKRAAELLDPDISSWRGLLGVEP